VDEFQDTSRAQWELVALLIKSWREGTGIATNPSIFVVGDRKQSIYRFRDAEAAVLEEAARHIQTLRIGANPRRSITKSFRALPGLLSFVNELFVEMADEVPGGGRFTYGEGDKFPTAGTSTDSRFVLGIAAANDPIVCAGIVADEIARVLKEDSVRDRKTGAPRQARPGDIGVLFRSRASHREFEKELERRGVPTYVYKGLGFFDADETKDLMALIRYLANPASDLRAAAFLRSRFIRLSDAGLATLSPRLADALLAEVDQEIGRQIDGLGAEDQQVLSIARRFVPAWVARVDVVPPAELIETILSETAYAYELRGPRHRQAWENVKKMRGLIRRIQNHGYATMPRIADHLDSLTAGDESNAVLEALDAVNLMTVHASKGLEFPIVFVVNMAKGASGPPRPVRVTVETDAEGEEQSSVSVGPFVSEMDEAERLREKHETKRLLYVALTRARDRLYLASALKDSALVPGRGSLAEVFPQSMKDLFARAFVNADPVSTVTWRSGKVGIDSPEFQWQVCRETPMGEPSGD
jgi:ATP-dependent helicase/nuclease subunit A